jgi:hypothetical protein
MGRVFILGAGASRFAGYPLGLDLWPFIRDSAGLDVMAKKRAESVIQAMDRILKVVPPKTYDRPNLEELFTLLDLAGQGVEPLGLRHVDWRDMRTKVMGMISEAFLSRQYQFQAELRSNPNSEPSSVLRKWTGFLQNDDTIITFNWDVVHEAALWRAGKWHYADGYGFVCLGAPAGKHSLIKVLKLHGSANWAQREDLDCEPAIEHKATFFPGALDEPGTYMKGGGQWNEGRNLIIPSYLKDVSRNRLLLQVWNEAADALAAASEVIVIGFQLHPADAPARQLLGSALLRNKGISEVLLVSPSSSGDYWDEFCFRLGKMRKPARKSFEAWVLGL